MCNRQFPEAFQFGEVNGPLQTWVSQKDAQVVQISCHDKEWPQLGASCIEREEIMDLFVQVEVEMGSHCVHRSIANSQSSYPSLQHAVITGRHFHAQLSILF